MVEDDDILIGAMAIANNGILVTNNARHLSRIQDITLEVWQQAPRKKTPRPPVGGWQAGQKLRAIQPRSGTRHQ